MLSLMHLIEKKTYGGNFTHHILHMGLENNHSPAEFCLLEQLPDICRSTNFHQDFSITVRWITFISQKQNQRWNATRTCTHIYVIKSNGC